MTAIQLIACSKLLG